MDRTNPYNQNSATKIVEYPEPILLAALVENINKEY